MTSAVNGYGRFMRAILLAITVSVMIIMLVPNVFHDHIDTIIQRSNTLTGIDRVYVLTASEERAEYMRRLLGALDIDFQFFPGLTSDNAIMQDYMQKVLAWSDSQPGSTWASRISNASLAGRIGCDLGHAAIWRDIAKNRIGTTMILEDDVDIDLSFPTTLTQVMRDIPSNWGMLYPGYCSMSWHPNKTWGPPPDDGIQFHRLSRAACGHAYILKLDVVDTLLRRPEILEPVFEIAWDNHMAHFISDGVIEYAYGMTPDLIRQRPKSRNHQSLVSNIPKQKPRPHDSDSSAWNKPDKSTFRNGRWELRFPREQSTAYKAGISYWHDLPGVD